LQSQLSGRIEKVLVRPNQIVRAGQPLVTLDRSSLLAKQRQLLIGDRQLQQRITESIRQHDDALGQIESARRSNSAQINASKGEVAKSQAALALAATEMRRFAELSKVGAVPQLLAEEKSTKHLISISELRQSQLAVTRQRAEAESELARLRQATSSLSSLLADLSSQSAGVRQQLDEVGRALASSVIRSPFAGSVLSLNVKHPAEVVSPGDVVAAVAPLRAPLQVQVTVSSSEISRVKSGSKAYLRVAGCSASDFGLLPARVEAVAADVSPAATSKQSPQSQSQYLVTIKPGAASLRRGSRSCQLRYGMNVQADILSQRTTMMAFLLSKLRLISVS
jgi:HlyD family secretion protein